MWPLRKSALRRLAHRDRADLLALLELDPVASVLMRVPVDSGRSLSSALGYFDGERLLGAAWNSGNLIPIGFPEEGLDALANHLRRNSPVASSIVGPADQVMGLWRRLDGAYPPARDVRPHQYSMVFAGGPELVGDRLVRAAHDDEFEKILPASVAMFTEEVGYDPLRHGESYPTRVRSLINAGRTFVRMSPTGERVEFKADIGALAGGVAQIQGVWTAPDLRGEGIASAAMVSVARLAQYSLAPTVSLYVNDFNLPAVHVYEKSGFVTVGEYATVLL